MPCGRSRILVPMRLIDFRGCVLALLGVVLCAPAATQEDPYLEDLRAAERYASKGKRARAANIFEEILADAEDFGVGGEGPSAFVVRAARFGLFDLALIAGEYRDVLRDVGGLPKADRDAPDAVWLRAEAHTAVGEFEQAITLFERELEREADDFRAACRLGELYAEVGRHEDARATWRRIVDRSRAESLREPEAMAWIARAHVRLGTRADYEQASALLVDAVKREPQSAMHARILLGWLRFLAYGESGEFEHGETVIKKVLEDHGDVEEALLTLYRIRKANASLDGSKTADLLNRALDLNPNSVDALMLRGVQLLDDRRFAEGAEMLDRALAINPRDKEVLAQRSAAAHLRGNAAAAGEYRERAMALDRDFAGVDLALGDRLVALYRFEDSIPAYERAIEQDPESVDALHGLAKACIYTGQGERARKLLDQASELHAGLVHPWRHNMLAIEELLDEEYERIETDRFVYRIHRDDRAVLGEYLIPFQEEAGRVLGQKYGFVPDEPVTVEVLHTWDDFSVRTIGFRGFTALGACFGKLITLVAPSDGDLRTNDFMWTATVWHEYAHVLTLELSKARVPRWLTEGFSVYEERVKSRAWERGMERELLDAYHNVQIPPVRLLNRLFRGPRILFGYYQGGLIVEYLTREFGFDRLIEMLRLYGEDLPQEEIFKQSFGIDTREFDRRFLAYVRDELIDDLRIVPRYDERAVQRMLDRVALDDSDVETHVKLAWAMLQRGIAVDVSHHLRTLRKLDPGNAEAKLIYARLLLQGGDVEGAVREFEAGFDGGADDFDSRIEYGKLLVKLERLDDAARHFLAAKRCWPRCTDQSVAPPVLLAKLYRSQGRRTEAMMELKMFCSLTARAFQPRMTLAAWENEAGNHRAEAKLLDEAVQIDPFMRSLHVRYGRALVELGRFGEAAREFRVALAIPPEIDREFLRSEERPSGDSPEYRDLQAETCVDLARALDRAGDRPAARQALERAIRESADSGHADAARELLELWR